MCSGEHSYIYIYKYIYIIYLLVIASFKLFFPLVAFVLFIPTLCIYNEKCTFWVSIYLL